MSEFRKKMIESEIMKLFNKSYYTLRDPELKGHMVNTNYVKLAKDKSYVDVYVSALDGDMEKIVKKLNKAQGFFRKIIAENIRMFKVPEVRFHIDQGLQASVKVHKLLDSIEYSDENKDEQDDKSDE
ncbi:30S ribosome-binding factor RbfA [Geotoga petraea]|jgi:ribosome-binding factor A|uniref:Ribosome-binding factor A n=1 Tax=Geotoga petraea TaxID=28234 RepID=A0A1G6IHL6_9BACT|nr:30S ribosome-binding factor RbfA [Geotoga petraea]MDK2945262.1 ribosome-binding factor [Geotoga sp.]TGG89208.1 30S ribosome-binding factor RbfA [Geotoga petraea]SDC05954.1 ribosome-binding factor A [Geotoga petraea]